MNEFEAYSYLFFDELISGLVFTYKSELVIDVMNFFKTYNLSYAIIISITANSCANLINIIIGKMIRSVKMTNNFMIYNKNYQLSYMILNKLTPALLTAASIPLIGALSMLIIGLFEIRLKKIYIIYLIIGKLAYYNFRLFYLYG